MMEAQSFQTVQRQNSMFLDIPTEIRHQILQDLLKSSTPLSRVTNIVSITRQGSQSEYLKHDTTYWRFELGGRLNLHPVILRVCRQLYQEAVPLLYHNTLVIHAALFTGFEPVDVLGHWRFDDLIDPPPRSRLPHIGRFSNLEFRIFVDFTRRSATSHGNELALACTQLADVAPNPLDSVAISVTDGSNTTRFANEGYALMWSRTVGAFQQLRCRELRIEGDVPPKFVAWLTMRMLIENDLTEHDKKELTDWMERTDQDLFKLLRTPI